MGLLSVVARRSNVTPSDHLGLTDEWDRVLVDTAVAVYVEEQAGDRLQQLERVNPLMALLAMGGS